MDRIAVCVCTYRRPLQLGRLLKALAEIVRPSDTSFVIVDNDGRDRQTETLVRHFREGCGSTVTYVVEPEPGLSPARNRALRTARATGAAAVAFLDDDEWPSAQWLTKLIETRVGTGAAVVGGPILPVFESGLDLPAKYQALWSVQKGRLRGLTHVYCTCNCLVDLTAAELLGDQAFPEEFRFTGGEDVVFFRRLHTAGVKMAWSDDAVVFEEIPRERATMAWLRRRWYRLGNIGVRCERAAPVGEAFAPLSKTLLLLLRLSIYPLFNTRALTMPLLWLLEFDRVRGRFASHAGYVVTQYGREPIG